jgi:hypothetical protein
VFGRAVLQDVADRNVGHECSRGLVAAVQAVVGADQLPIRQTVGTERLSPALFPFIGFGSAGEKGDVVVAVFGNQMFDHLPCSGPDHRPCAALQSRTRPSDCRQGQYVGRLVQDPQDIWVLLAFVERNELGSFGGFVIDPRPVHWNDDPLRVTGQERLPT